MERPGRAGETGGGVQDGVTESVDLAVGDDGLVGKADELGLKTADHTTSPDAPKNTWPVFDGNPEALMDGRRRGTSPAFRHGRRFSRSAK